MQGSALHPPFGAPDALTRDQMKLALQHAWSATGKTILFVTHSIAEAVFLADRVVVTKPRPGSIALELEVNFPRPRRMAMRETPEFGRYCSRIRTLFEGMELLKEE